MKERFLSKDEIFAEPYCDRLIKELMEFYRLEFESSSLEDFRYNTPRELKYHYDVEVELARQLRNADRADRTHLYRSLYDELFTRVPSHPQLIRKQDFHEDDADGRIPAFLGSHLLSDTVFLELGPGDCALCFAVARRVRKVFGIDVSEEITRHKEIPSNFELILSDGTSVDVQPGSVDVAYSNQLMEHLHPDDAMTQLIAIYQALKPGGIYIMTTPHRFGGPADVSRFFDTEARGFHLKEYTNEELHTLLKAVGFDRIWNLRRIGSSYLKVPQEIAMFVEKLITAMPRAARRPAYRRLKSLLSLRLLASKAELN